MKVCELCEHCEYLGEGDYYCDMSEDFSLIYEDFMPTEEYMLCKGKYFKRG